MLIDWFTVGAQALNFLVLVWLLKHFLYKPILKAIDAREKLIAEKLAGAEAKMVEATKERDEFKQKNDELDQRRAALLSDMETEIKTERQRLLDEARKAADAWAAKRQESTKIDAQNLNLAIGHQMQQEVFAVARRALKDLSTSNLEQGVGTLFIQRVRDLDEKRKEVLAEALKTASGPAILRSAFELSAEQRATMQDALNVALSADITITYEVTPELISGIEFVTNGQKISWSIAEYLTSLENSVDDLLKRQTTHQARHEAKPPAAPKPPAAAKSETKPEAKPETKPEAKPDVAANPREDKPTDEAHAHGP